MSVVKILPLDIFSGKSFAGWFGLISAIVIIFGIPALIFPSGKITFDSSTGEYISTRDPDFIFIGNSLLDGRINPDLIETLTNGGKVDVLMTPGTASAVWYLTLKNQIIQSGAQPKTVFIIFETDDLTFALRGTTEQYRAKIEALSGQS
jgi:hypothetical protein